VLDRVKAGAFGKGPAGKYPLGGAVQQKLIDLDEGGCLRHFGCRACIAGPGGYLKRSESYGLSHLDFKRRNPARDLVERREHGNRICNRGAACLCGYGQGGKKRGDRR
jgi:hypothetical protein